MRPNADHRQRSASATVEHLIFIALY